MAFQKKQWSKSAKSWHAFPACNPRGSSVRAQRALYRNGSDIDLALVGAALDWRTVGKINDALDDLLLPYRFSLVVYDENTGSEVAAHIDRVGTPLFERHHSAGE